MDLLTTQVLDLIYRHAGRTYPSECCGFVLADGSVHEGTNIQDEIHAVNPATYRRTAANGYTFSVLDTVFLNNSFRTQNPVIVIYHSHPDVGAYFSHEDVDKALYDGEPIYPVDYLVVDAMAGAARGAKLFRWRRGQFVCTGDFDRDPCMN
ncbi:JAB1/Mov34/MPN/PAD-1 ubiquitin protease family protein [Paraburkholderia ribeironis]|uniref:JAB1/Mov34/MPN/PAD-1 ubiquitin protease family protein n=1 Tax=Paraburkholderia ribeironis TaxID=1247936 RepID=A0A1N7S8X6_9BURK|nr:Mov34/MPN/PAD-1 family protein [Paraburkholderia ribeironis]SIT43840.1 JAB1/Mov34/MPN/PAD-1 ubiquitin protease family protein [Paraburkholderia ribeironis]